MATFFIGAVAERTGLARSTLRYYESIGLLKPAGRTPAGYRIYLEGAIAELRFVRRAQALGFSLDDIADLLRLHRRGISPCERVVAIARKRLLDADAELRELGRFRDRLADEIARWEACPELASTSGSACALIECHSCEAPLEFPASTQPRTATALSSTMLQRRGRQALSARPNS